MPRQYGYPRGTFIGADEDTTGDDEGVDSPFQFTQYAKRRQTPGGRQGARDPRARSRYTGMRPRQQEVESVASAPTTTPITTPAPIEYTAAEIKQAQQAYTQDQIKNWEEDQKKRPEGDTGITGTPTGMSAAQAGAQNIVGSPFGYGTATDLGLTALDLSQKGITGAKIGVGAGILASPTVALATIQHGRQVAALQGQVSPEALTDPAAIAAVQGQTPVSGLTSAQQAHVMDIQVGKRQARATTGLKGTLSSIAKGLQLDDLVDMLGITGLPYGPKSKGVTSVTADDLAITESPTSLVADPITRGFSSANENFAMDLELEELGLTDLDLGFEADNDADSTGDDPGSSGGWGGDPGGGFGV